jgi:predicted MPP superfamily phosphohydrolase
MMIMMIPAFMVMVFIIIIVLFVLYESRKVEFDYYTVPIAQLPAELENLRIAVLSDIHYSPQMEESFLDRIISCINEEHPDMVLITGDLASFHTQWVLQIPDILQKLSSRYGTYVVPGNHDHCYGRQALMKNLQSVGITVLKNQHVSVGSKECSIQLIGIDDPATYRDETEEVLEKLPREGMRILMCHSPDGIRPAIREKVPLILTGHTHGGQIRLPFIGALFLPTREEREFDKGWFRQSQSWIYVSRGLGNAGFPVRLFCPREVAMVTLTSSGSTVVAKKKSL